MAQWTGGVACAIEYSYLGLLYNVGTSSFPMDLMGAKQSGLRD